MVHFLPYEYFFDEVFWHSVIIFAKYFTAGFYTQLRTCDTEQLLK